MGRHAGAEPFYREALQVRRTALGEAHPRYAIRLNNLASTLQAMGRHAEAEPSYRQAIEIDRATIGKAHPDYAIHLGNLISLLQAMGRFADADPLYGQAVYAFCDVLATITAIRG
jgi:tetratricopeptide (TPR) repeat protein